MFYKSGINIHMITSHSFKFFGKSKLMSNEGKIKLKIVLYFTIIEI